MAGGESSRRRRIAGASYAGQSSRRLITAPPASVLLEEGVEDREERHPASLAEVTGARCSSHVRDAQLMNHPAPDLTPAPSRTRPAPQPTPLSSAASRAERGDAEPGNARSRRRRRWSILIRHQNVAVVFSRGTHLKEARYGVRLRTHGDADSTLPIRVVWVFGVVQALGLAVGKTFALDPACASQGHRQVRLRFHSHARLADVPIDWRVRCSLPSIWHAEDDLRKRFCGPICLLSLRGQSRDHIFLGAGLNSMIACSQLRQRRRTLCGSLT